MLENSAVQLAYIDPGTGSLLLQFIIAGVIGVGISVRQRLGACVAWIWQKAAR